MIQHAREFQEAGVPFIFDPGQGLPMFGGDDIRTFLQQADYLACNDYEAQLMQEKTGESMERLARSVKAAVAGVTAKANCAQVQERRLPARTNPLA